MEHIGNYRLTQSTEPILPGLPHLDLGRLEPWSDGQKRSSPRKGRKLSQGRMVGADRVAEELGISESHAYVVIRELNQELEAAGFLTVRGKVDYAYLCKRYFFPVEPVKSEGKEE